MKDVIEKIPEAIKEIKQSSTNFLGFVGLMVFALILGIVGLAWLSKLPIIFNLIIIGIFLVVVLYILIRTFNSAIKNPQPFIFNQNAFIAIRREKLADSESENFYYSNKLAVQNTEAPKQISETNQIKSSE